MQAWVAKVYEDRIAAELAGKPLLNNKSQCLPAGFPHMMLAANYPIQILQTPGQVTMIFEEDSRYRLIMLDQKHPDDLDLSYNGHSTGKWEGNTLVVDSVGFNGKAWLDPGGHVATEKLHVIERITRTEPNLIQYEFTIDDPGAYTKPWGWGYPLYGHPDWEIIEYVCNENNKDVEHMIQGNK